MMYIAFVFEIWGSDPQGMNIKKQEQMKKEKEEEEDRRHIV